MLSGGLPLGSVCELTGPNGAGHSSIALSLLARASTEGACAYIDVSYTLSPQSAAAGVELSNLLWVRFAVDSQPQVSSIKRQSRQFQAEGGSHRPIHGSCGSSHPRGETKGLAPALEQMLFDKEERRRRKMEGTPGHPNQRGEIDLLVMPEQFLSPLHPSLQLLDDVYVCVGWNQNPLLPECLSMDEYLRFSHVAVHFTTQQTGTLDDWIFQSKGRSRTIAVTASAYNLLPQLVVGTPHLATLQKRLALLYASWLPIRIVEAQLGLSALVERVQWHRFRNNDPGIAWMRSVIAEQAQWVKSTDPTAASAYSKLHAVSVS